MATNGYGIATYQDLIDEFEVSDSALSTELDQCPTRSQIVDGVSLQVNGDYLPYQLVMFKDVSFAEVIRSITLVNALPDSVDIDSVHVGEHADNGYFYESGDPISGTLYGDSQETVNVTIDSANNSFGICFDPPYIDGIDWENDGFNYGYSPDEVAGQLWLDTDPWVIWGNISLARGTTIYLGTGYNTYTPIYFGFTNDCVYAEYTELTNFEFGFAVESTPTVHAFSTINYIGWDETGEYLPYDTLASSSGVDLTRLWSYTDRASIVLNMTFSPNITPHPRYADLVAYLCDDNGNPMNDSSYQVLGTIQLRDEGNEVVGSLNTRVTMEDIGSLEEPYNKMAFMLVFKNTADDQYWNEGGSGDPISVYIGNNSSYQARIAYRGEDYSSESLNLYSGNNTDIYIPRDYSPNYNISIRLTNGSRNFRVQTNTEEGEREYTPNSSGYVNIPYSDIYMYPNGYTIYILNY